MNTVLRGMNARSRSVFDYGRQLEERGVSCCDDRAIVPRLID